MSTSDGDFQRYLLPPEPEEYGFFKFLGDSVKAFFEFLADTWEGIGWTLGGLAALGVVALVIQGAYRTDAGNREKLKNRDAQEAEIVRTCVGAGGTYMDSPQSFGGTCIVAGKATTYTDPSPR